MLIISARSKWGDKNSCRGNSYLFARCNSFSRGKKV